MGQRVLSNFYNDLEFSRGEREKTDIDILKKFFNTDSVIKTDKTQDIKGIDYIVTLKGGATINIDAKTRKHLKEKDFTSNGVVLAIETWSVMPYGNYVGKVGWTFSENSNVDYILYTFPKEQWNKYYIIPFQLLKKVAEENKERWKECYGLKMQTTQRKDGTTYNSQCLFIPDTEIRSLIYAKMQVINK